MEIKKGIFLRIGFKQLPYITVYFTTTYHYFITTKQGCGCVFIFRGLCGLSRQAAIAREECCQQNE